jgi:hypothetical protein
MKKLLGIVVLGLLLSNTASALPKCQGEDISKWTMCKGVKITSKGSKYSGEFKDGKYHGQGTINNVTGDQYTGGFKSGKFYGKGTLTHSNGEKKSGVWKDGKVNEQSTIKLTDEDKKKQKRAGDLKKKRIESEFKKEKKGNIVDLKISQCDRSEFNKLLFSDIGEKQQAVKLLKGREKKLFEKGWNKTSKIETKYLVAEDLDDSRLLKVKEGIDIAQKYLCNYGSLKVFIIGKNVEVAKKIAKEFCSWAYPKSFHDACMRDQGVEIIEIAEYSGTNGFQQSSRNLKNPNTSFVIGNPGESVYVTIHEYVHVYQNAHKLNDNDNDHWPFWFEEGSATYLGHYLADGFAERNNKETSYQVTAVLKNCPKISLRNYRNRQSISKLENNCKDDHAPHLFFAIGSLATAFLVNKTSHDQVFKKFIPSVAYVDWTKAFEESFGLTLEKFYKEFDKFIHLTDFERLERLTSK